MFASLLIWNVTLAALMAAVVAFAGMTRYVRERPALKHWLWLIVLCKLVTPPLLPLPILAGQDSLLTLTGTVPRIEAGIERANEFSASSVRDAAPLALQAKRSDREETLTASTSRGFVHWRISLCLIWLVIALALAIRVLAPVLRLVRLIRRGDWDNDRVNGIVSREALRTGISRSVNACVVQARVTPLLWVRQGRPVVVIPHALLSELTDEQVSCVAAHELAHFRRRDHWWNGFAWIVGVLFWWNPVVWWARYELKFAQEVCCDAIVISRNEAVRRPYAETLLQVVDFVVAEDASPQLAAGFGDATSIEKRFEMIANENVTHRLSRPAWMVLAVFLVATCCYPVLAQTESGSPQQSDEVPAQDLADRSSRSEKQLLHGLWQVIDEQHRGVETPLAFDENSWHFDRTAASVTTRWRERNSWGVGENRYTIDVTTTPHHLTIYGDNLLIQAIIDINGDEMTVAHFGRSQAARPRSFTDERDEFGPLVVKKLKRMKARSHGPSIAESSRIGSETNSVPSAFRAPVRDKKETGTATRTFALKNYQAQHVPDLIAAMGIELLVEVNRRTNTVNMSGTPEQLSQVEKLLGEIDRSEPSKKFHVLELRNVDAKAAALVIRKTFGDSDNLFKVDIDEKQNRLLLHASEKQVKQIRDLVAGLEWFAESNETDAPNDKGKSQ